MFNLEAVLLAAGNGSGMVGLTKEKPKCLLPLGNQCLIWYAITNLKSIGVNRIICLITDIHENEIKQYCYKKFNMFKDLSIEFVTVASRDGCGTAESIVGIKDKITRDFIVYSCDSIVHPKSLLALVNHYRLYDPTLTMLFSDNPNYFIKTQIPGRNDKERALRDLVAVESLDKAEREPEDGFSENKVVFMRCERDLMQKSKLKIRNRELALHPSIQVYSCYLDSHIYILKRELLEFMVRHSDRKVLKSEIIPLILTKQFSNRHLDSEICEDDDDDVGIQTKSNNFDYETDLKLKLEAFHPYNVVNSIYYHKVTHIPKTIECHAIVTNEDLFTYRVNTIGSFLSSNSNAKNILKEYSYLKTNFMKDSPIGENTILGNKCLLKKSCIGNNVKIGDKVKIFECVIMDDVEIESNSSLSECIVGSGSKIGSKCDLKLCIIGYKQKLAPGLKSKNEVLINGGHSIDTDEIMFE